MDYAVSALSNANGDFCRRRLSDALREDVDGILRSSDRMRLTMQKRPRAFLFQIVTAKDRFRHQDIEVAIPFSVEGSVGINLSLGVSGLTLALAQ